MSHVANAQHDPHSPCFLIGERYSGFQRKKDGNFSTDGNIKSHLMICHLSLVLLTTCRERLRKNGILLAPEVALRKLESIYKVYLRGKNKKSKNDILFNCVNTLSQSQKRILNAVAPKIKCSEEKPGKS